jgi:hypothetical protein
MGIGEQMRRAYEKEAARILEREKDLEARLRAASLSPEHPDAFKRGEPNTSHGWDLYEKLLIQEGALDAAQKEWIQRGRESIIIDRAMADLRAATGLEADPFDRWNAIVSVGLDKDPYYRTEHEKARRASEAHQIRLLSESIRKRVAAGESLPVPFYSDGEPVKPQYANPVLGALVEWQAIRELGFGDDPHYSRQKDAATAAMAGVSRRRGDFEKHLRSLQKRHHSSSPEEQQPAPPSDFVEVEVVIPMAALKGPTSDLGFIRYHPELGLVRGHVREFSHYDRGVGSYPGSRGARKEYVPSVALLLEQVDFRKCKGIRKQSVWRVINDPPVIVGRDKPTASTEISLSYPQRFDSNEEAERYFQGAIESDFIRDTLPVLTVTVGDTWRMRFFARPLPEA